MPPSPRPATPALSEGAIEQIARALKANVDGEADYDVRLALDETCREAHSRGLPAEAVVLALRLAWSRVPRPDQVTNDAWTRGYYAAVGKCLSMYFGEDG